MSGVLGLQGFMGDGGIFLFLVLFGVIVEGFLQMVQVMGSGFECEVVVCWLMKVIFMSGCFVGMEFFDFSVDLQELNEFFVVGGIDERDEVK